MSLLFFEGFETIGDATGEANRAGPIAEAKKRWEAVNESVSPSTDGQFLIDDVFGQGFALHMGNGSASNQTSLVYQFTDADMLAAPTSSTPVGRFGFRFHNPSIARTFSICLLRGRFGEVGFDTQMNVEVLTGTSLRVTLGTTAITADVFTETGIFTLSDWHYVEIEIKPVESGDGGKCIIHVDDVQIFTKDPQDCNKANSLSAYWDLKFTGASSSGAAEDYAAYDDFYILRADQTPNTGRLSPCRVRRLALASDQDAMWDNKVEMSLGTTLDAASETSLDVGTGNVPPDAPQTGTLRVTLDTASVRDIDYTAHNSDDTFTIVDESWANPNDATAGNLVTLSNFASNYTKVDENGFDENDYVETDITQNRDRYNIEDLTTISDKPVQAVKVEAEARNETGGTPSLQLEVQSPTGTSAEKFTVSDTVNYDIFESTQELDPGTGLPWSPVDIDSTRAGIVLDNEVG